MLKLWYPDITKENFLQCCHIATTFLIIRYRIFFSSNRFTIFLFLPLQPSPICLVCFLSLKLFKPTLVKMRTWSFKSTDLKCNTQRNLRFNKIEERVMGSPFMCPSCVWDIENGVLRKKRAGQSGINWNSLFLWDCGIPLTSGIGEEYWIASNLGDYVVVMAAAVSPFGNSCIGFQKCPFGLDFNSVSVCSC